MSNDNNGKTDAEQARADRVGHFIKEWRIYRGLSQKEVADRMKFSNAALSQLEKGWTGYRQDMLVELAKALDCHPADLLRHPPTVVPPDADQASMDEYARLYLSPEQRAQMFAIMVGIAQSMHWVKPS